MDTPVPMIAVAGLSAEASRIAARFYDDPSASMFIVGITGTNGKTSCAQFISRALAPEIRCASIGTLGIGFPDDLRQSSRTTPDAVSLQQALADLKAAGAQAVAMEVSSHALEQGRVAAVAYDLALFTNLSRDHLDYHGTLEAYGAAKRKLFAMPGIATWVVNLDDPFGRRLVADAPADVSVIGYGQRESVRADAGSGQWLLAREVIADASGLRILLESSYGEASIESRLLGRFNVSNLLAVLGVLLQRGMALAEAVKRLARLTTVPGRMERFGGGGQPLVIVDYAHTPDALEQVLSAGRGHAQGRLICVFGCGGDRDNGKRPQMAAIGERLADRVVVTDDNPRSEDGDRIVAQILAGMRQPDAAVVERNRAAAIERAVSEAQAGDVVVVAGKGHEDYQLVGERVLHFDDREQVRRVLAGGAR
jgi:UDP-N-acetylmuramoyl-L-alanyl-D-glutamate--2,6-diaminopimelate ligase